jgi:hypothetical protein
VKPVWKSTLLWPVGAATMKVLWPWEFSTLYSSRTLALPKPSSVCYELITWSSRQLPDGEGSYGDQNVQAQGPEDEGGRRHQSQSRAHSKIKSVAFERGGLVGMLLRYPGSTMDSGTVDFDGQEVERVVLLARVGCRNREIITALSNKCRKHDLSQFSTLERAFSFWSGRNTRGVRGWDGRSVEISPPSNCHRSVFDPRPFRCSPGNNPF